MYTVFYRTYHGYALGYPRPGRPTQRILPRVPLFWGFPFVFVLGCNLIHFCNRERTRHGYAPGCPKPRNMLTRTRCAKKNSIRRGLPQGRRCEPVGLGGREYQNGDDSLFDFDVQFLTIRRERFTTFTQLCLDPCLDKTYPRITPV